MVLPYIGQNIAVVTLEIDILIANMYFTLNELVVITRYWYKDESITDMGIKQDYNGLCNKLTLTLRLPRCFVEPVPDG